jgi:hypothetical protein
MTHIVAVKIEIGDPFRYWSWCENCLWAFAGPYLTEEEARTECQGHAAETTVAPRGDI